MRPATPTNPRSAQLLALLTSRTPIVLDGATGTELGLRGVDIAQPLWSAGAIKQSAATLQAVHADYVAAGARAITANTFRCHARNLADAGAAQTAAQFVTTAVALARQASPPTTFVFGAQAPLADCYAPELTPNQSVLDTEHAQMSATLAAAKVDAILVETMPTIREAISATSAALATGLPVLTSVVCGNDGHLLSGELLAAAVRAIDALQPAAILVNCVPAPRIAALLPVLAEHTDLPFGAYGNTGCYLPEEDRWIDTDATNPQTYAAYAQQWVAQGATIVGGCCYTRPAHIAAVQTLFKN